MFPVYYVKDVTGLYRYHSPLEGESQKSSRMTKADAVGGSHKASQRRDLVRRNGNRRRASVAVGESQKPSRMAKADAEGGQRGVPQVSVGGVRAPSSWKRCAFREALSDHPPMSARRDLFPGPRQVERTRI